MDIDDVEEREIKTGYFVFEGMDGVGKTTTIKNVAMLLLAKNYDFILTKEPGGPKALFKELGFPMSLRDKLGERYEGFRHLCVDNPQIPALTKRGLYRADAFYNWERVVYPNLVEGKTVISDRSWVSDLAYGTVLTGASIEDLYDFNTSLVPLMAPLTQVIYLEAPREVREARLALNMADAMDKLGVEKRDLIAAAYDTVLDRYIEPESVWRVSTDAPPEEVARIIVDIIISQ